MWSRVARLFRRQVVANPPGETVFVNSSRGNIADNNNRLGIIGNKVYAIQTKEGDDRKESCAFVPIDERMVPRDTKGISRRQGRQPGFLVRPFVPRPAQRRLKCPFVANSRRPAKSPQLSFMNLKYKIDRQPNRLGHFANSSRALR